MGQTLTHGIYLPDEGERNCYNGLAGNWQLLDGAVGTIAEHTSALSGKAPLVHTHTKADITDFPAYGTTAGTICEGNDSRLSDARTPVAHTHTKSDVTDLFNSANTWTALNSYNQSIQITANFNIGAAPSSDVYGGFNFGNGTSNIGNVTARVSSAGITYSRLYVSNKYANGALDPNGDLKNVELQVGLKANGNRFIYSNASWDNSLIPYANNAYDLGSSSYQWNNLYAKNYYYNGVAWGLDKANTWSAWQTQEHTTEPLIRLRRSNLQIGDPIPASQQIIGTIPFADKNNLNLGLIACRDNTNGDTYLTFTARQRYDSNGRANNGTQYESRIDLGTDSSHNLYLRPNSNADINLGTSTNKWKTLNGVNPGALSLPNLASDGYIDLSDHISVNTEYSYTPTVDGWLALYCQTIGFHAENAVGIFNGYGSSYSWACSVTSAINLPRLNKYHGAVILPVKAGLPYFCWITVNSSTTSSTTRLYFYKATGNV